MISLPGSTTLYDNKTVYVMDILCSEISPQKDKSPTQELPRHDGEISIGII